MPNLASQPSRWAFRRLSTSSHRKTDLISTPIPFDYTWSVLSVKFVLFLRVVVDLMCSALYHSRSSITGF